MVCLKFNAKSTGCGGLVDKSEIHYVSAFQFYWLLICGDYYPLMIYGRYTVFEVFDLGLHLIWIVYETRKWQVNRSSVQSYGLVKVCLLCTLLAYHSASGIDNETEIQEIWTGQ